MSRNEKHKGMNAALDSLRDVPPADETHPQRSHTRPTTIPQTP